MIQDPNHFYERSDHYNFAKLEYHLFFLLMAFMLIIINLRTVRQNRV
jgi:hypothetical protein